MGPHPQLEVLRSVVELVPVAVMHRLIGEQWPTEMLLHDNSVLHDSALPVVVNAAVAVRIDAAGTALADLESKRIAVMEPALVVQNAPPA
jgi:hypothetical protein